MAKYLIFSYSLIGYMLSIISLTFMILWIFPWSFMEFYIDNPMVDIDANPLLINTSLILLFGLQHSLMARSFFKDGLLKNVSIAVKSATYSVASSISLIVLFYFWQPIYGYAWNFQNDTIFWSVALAFSLAWSFSFISTFMIDHFELFGLHQGYRALKHLPEPESKFQAHAFYKYVRHPIQTGTLIGLWATPSMSYAHLVLSMGFTVYIFLGLYYEEKSLVRAFGQEYEDYIKNTPMLIPFRKKKNNSFSL